MKKSGKVLCLLVITVILVLSISLISAGFWEDVMNKITGKAISGNETGLVFYNKLGSDYEVLNSEVGPNLKFYDLGSYAPEIQGDREYVSGKEGNAVTIKGVYGSTHRVHNLVLENPGNTMNAQSGTIEVWFYQTARPKPYQYGIYRLFDGGFGLNSGMGFYLTDQDLVFDMSLGGTNTRVSYGVSNIPVNEWVHLAAVWDKDSIDPLGDKMRIYVNGQKVASTSSANWGTSFGSRADICGGNDAGIAGKFYMDELVIWSISKTDFDVGGNGTQCIDSDGGINYDVKGSCTDSFGAQGDDECLDRVTLSEKYCSAKPDCFAKSYDCPHGCSNGACITEAPQPNVTVNCNDTDGGINYFTKGSVSGNIGSAYPAGLETYTDYCTSDNQSLIERYCTDDYTNFTTHYPCEYGCSDGACLTEPTRSCPEDANIVLGINETSSLGGFRLVEINEYGACVIQHGTKQEWLYPYPDVTKIGSFLVTVRGIGDDYCCFNVTYHGVTPNPLIKDIPPWTLVYNYSNIFYDYDYKTQERILVETFGGEYIEPNHPDELQIQIDMADDPNFSYLDRYGGDIYEEGILYLTNYNGYDVFGVKYESVYGTEYAIVWFSGNKMISIGKYVSAGEGSLEDQVNDISEFVNGIKDNRFEYIENNIYDLFDDEERKIIDRYLITIKPDNVQDFSLGSWECKLEPVICPPHGRQTQICRAYNYKTNRYETREEEKYCSPGMCAGCYVPRYSKYARGDNVCIPYGIRLMFEEGEEFKVYENEINSYAEVASLNINSDYNAVFTLIEDVSTDIEKAEINGVEYYGKIGESITLNEGWTYDIYIQPMGWAAEEYSITIDSIVYEPNSSLGSYIDVTINNEYPAYCDIDGRIRQQKSRNPYTGDWATCQNTYECKSNLCIEGECIEVADLAAEANVFKRVFVRAVCRISNLFSEEGYNSCIYEFLKEGPDQCQESSDCSSEQSTPYCKDGDACSDNTPGICKNGICELGETVTMCQECSYGCENGMCLEGNVSERGITVGIDNNRSIVVVTASLKDGEAKIPVLYGNGTHFTGNGKNEFNKLALGVSTVYVNENIDEHFIVGQRIPGTNVGESYLMSARIDEDIDGQGIVDLRNEVSGLECSKEKVGDICSIGYAQITVRSIDIENEIVELGLGQGGAFNKIYSTEGEELGLIEIGFHAPAIPFTVTKEGEDPMIYYALWKNGNPVVCGNGVIENGEQCDDGNDYDGDGCNANCDEELGWDCSGDADCTDETSYYCLNNSACTSFTDYGCVNGTCKIIGGGGGCSSPCTYGCENGVCLTNSTA